MKKHILLIFSFLLFTASLFAQANNNENTKQVRHFLDWHFKSVHKPLIVGESLDTFTFKHLNELLAKDTFYRRITYANSNTPVIDTICFNSNERKYIDSFFLNINKFSLDTSLLPNAIFFPAKTIDSLYKIPGGISNYLYQHYHAPHFFRISKPIFLKDYTMCVFYEEKLTGEGLGDEGMLVICKKVNGAWQVFWYLEQWNS